jgi:outer membrane receptor protein involved in Fe transport
MLKYYLPIFSSASPPPPVYLLTDAMVEANIGAKYQFSKHLEFFGKAENLFNRKDEPWYGYTVQGLRFKLGAGFSF